LSPRETIETALAHVIGDRPNKHTGGVTRREKRRKLMDAVRVL
jgi:hypothetical protein